MTDKHLKEIEWAELEAKDHGEHGLMNVVGYYHGEQSVFTTLSSMGDRNSPRAAMAQLNMTTAADYLLTVHRVGPQRLGELLEDFTHVAIQRNDSRTTRHHGVAVATHRYD